MKYTIFTSPYINQYIQFMENKLKNLEEKFSTRDRELRITMDEMRSANKLERSRLIGLHTQVQW